MSTGFALRTLAAAVSLAFVIGAFSSAAQAITDTIFRYAEPKTGSLMLGPGDFIPAGSSIPYNISVFQIVGASAQQQCFLASVRLPQFATITQMRVFYSRPVDADLVSVTMRRVNSAGNSIPFVANEAQTFAPVVDRGAVTYPAVASLAVVNNRQYRYVLQMCVANNGTFFNARVDYTYKDAGD